MQNLLTLCNEGDFVARWIVILLAALIVYVTLSVLAYLLAYNYVSIATSLAESYISKYL